MSQLITCPECKKHLQVPDELLGKTVQCPECKHTFTAQESTPTQVVSAAGAVASKPSAAPSSSAKKKAEWDRDDQEEEEDNRARQSKPPRKRSRRVDDDDDYDDDDERPRRRSRYGGYAPHRGGMILAFGILAFFVLPFVFGPMAWILGNADMAEIRAGRMDPTGESMVQTGRILGIVSTLISLLSLVAVVGFFCLLMMAVGMRGPRG